jgi:hypothetical protein
LDPPLQRAALDSQGKMRNVGTSKEKKQLVKQHDPTPEERDERVSLHPKKGEDVLRKLLNTPPKDAKKS